MNNFILKTLVAVAFLFFPVCSQATKNALEIELDNKPVIPYLDAHPLAKLFLNKEQIACKYSSSTERLHEWLVTTPLEKSLCQAAAFDIATHDANFRSNTVVPEDSLETLGLFSQNNKVLNLQKTRTHIGQASFAQLIAHPIANQQELLNRQEAVRTLTDAPALCREIHEALSRISKQESLISRWWIHCLHGAQRNPYHPALHELYARTGHLLGFVTPVATALGVFGLLGHYPNRNHDFRDGEGAVYLVGFSCLAAVIAASDIFTITNWQHLLTTYRQFLESASKLYEITKQRPAFKHIPNIQHLTDYFENSDTLPLRNFLKKSTFKGETSIFSSAGNINYAQSLLFKTMGHTARLMQAIGNLDAFLAVARLVSDHQLKDEKYCFVNFVESETSCFKLTNAWSPVFSQLPFYNFTLDGKNVLIAGVKNSGKTTTTQAVCHALVMAQTFGIVPAESCSLQPFYRILMTQDNQACFDNTKLFERIESSPIDSKILVILDVKHRRITNEELRKTATHLNKQPQVSTIVVTSNTSLQLENYQCYQMEEIASKEVCPGWNYTFRSK